MSPSERKLLRLVFEQLVKNDHTALRVMQSLEYEETPVSPEKFLTDPYYFGEVGKGLYPWIKADIPRLFNQGFEEVVLTGAQRTGKDTFAHIALSYLIHLLLCLKDPATSYGLAKGSTLHCVLLSATQEKAKEVVFGGLIEKIRQSPWFMKFGKSMKMLSEDLRFPKGIVVKGAESTDLGVVGLTTCVTGDTRIKLPSSQETIDTLLKIHGGQQFDIVNCKSGGLNIDRAFIIENGIKDVYEIKLTDGKALQVTGDHRLLVRKSAKYLHYYMVSEIVEGSDIVTEEEFKNYTNFYPFVCKVCGREGFSTNMDSKWCSSNCFYEYTRRTHERFYICSECGKEICIKGSHHRKRGKVITCSPICLRKFFKNRMQTNNPFKGHHHSEETKTALSLQKKGKKTGPCPAKGEATRRRWILYREKKREMLHQKRSDRMKAFWTLEKRQLASARMRGFSHSAESKKKIAENNSRRVYSDETRKKMSISISNLHKDKRNNYQYVGYLDTRFGKIGYRSQYERIALAIFDSDERVKTVQSEPFTVPYTFGGHAKNCLPDFLITLTDGAQKLIEVKSSYYIKMPISQAKLLATREYCKENNLSFELWDEKILCRLSGKKESEFYEHSCK
jgi:DNA-directed RNA polymerase subunit RPC12/RpoP